MRRYSVWFKDIDGNEDTLTVMVDSHDAKQIEATLQKHKEAGKVAEFVVIADSPYSFADALEYIAGKLSEVEA